MYKTFSLSPDILKKFGLPIERLCVHAGITPAPRWRTEEFFRLWLAADDILGDPAAGLRFGAGSIIHGYGIGAIVALHAPDFRGALSALSRYKRLICPELVEVDVVDNEVTVRYRWLLATGEVPGLLVDTALASLQELARRGTAGRVAPVRVELARRAANEALLEGHFSCPIVFGAEHDAMVFERKALDVPFVTADLGIFAQTLSQLESSLAEGQCDISLVGEVRMAIGQQLSEGVRPDAATVARKLSLSNRTMQRRLCEQNTSFQEQLAQVRRTLSGRLLANTNFDTIAIAMLLGFAEPNSFIRAFRRWERTTPLRWREQHTNTGLDTRTGTLP